MFRSRISAGVEVGASSMRIALVQPRPVPTVLRLEEVPLGPGDESRVGRIIADSLSSMGAQRAEVHVALSPAFCTVRHQLFVAPKLKRAELAQVTARELRRDGQFDAGGFLFDVESVGSVEVDGGGKATQYFALAASRPHVQEIATRLLAQGFAVRSATSSTVGVLRLGHQLGLKGGAVTAIVNLESKRSSIAVVDDGVPRFFREFPTATDAATGEPNAQAIAREVELSLVYFAQQHRPRTVEAVMVAGPADLAVRIANYLESRRAYEVLRVAPGDTLGVKAEVDKPVVAFASAIGMALGSSGRSVPNILPPEMRQRSERLAFALAGGAGLVMALLVILQLRAGHADDLEAAQRRVDAANAEVGQLMSTVSRAVELDKTSESGAQWAFYFDEIGSHQRRLGHLIHRLAGEMPDSVHLTGLLMKEFDPTEVRKAKQKDGTHHLQVTGIVRTQDTQAAQAALKQFVQSIEASKDVVRVELARLRTPDMTTGLVELPFAVDVFFLNPFTPPVNVTTAKTR